MSDNNINYGRQQPVQPGQPVPNQPQQKKPFFKRTWVIVTGAVLGIFIIIAAVNGGGSTPTDSADASAPSGGVTSSDKPADKEPSKAAAKPAVKPAAKKWVKLMTLTGKADKQSDTIKTAGGKIRISYNFTDTSGMDLVVAGIYFMDEGTDIQKDGAIPEVMVSDAGKDATTIRKDAGEYYLKVSAANVKYTVTVEEER